MNEMGNTTFYWIVRWMACEFLFLVFLQEKKLGIVEYFPEINDQLLAATVTCHNENDSCSTKKASFTVDLWHKVQIDNAKNRCNSVLLGTLFAKNILFVKSNIHGVSFRNGMNGAIKNVSNLKWVSFVCTSRSAQPLLICINLYVFPTLCVSALTRAYRSLLKNGYQAKGELYIVIPFALFDHFVHTSFVVNDLQTIECHTFLATCKRKRGHSPSIVTFISAHIFVFFLQFFSLHLMRFGVGSLSHFMKSLFKVYV